MKVLREKGAAQESTLWPLKIAKRIMDAAKDDKLRMTPAISHFHPERLRRKLCVSWDP